MNITYLILANNEPQIPSLLNFLTKYIDKQDDIVILHDDNNPLDIALYDGYRQKDYIKIILHKLEYSYSDHRNYALEFCTGDYIFAIDADECPNVHLMKNVKRLIDTHKADLYWIPRYNVFEGVTDADAAKYGWRVTNKNVVNWDTGDYQTRLFKNSTDIFWKGNLHERLVTWHYHKVIMLEKHIDYALIHKKTIQKQLETNLKYNTKYTVSENAGQV